MVQPGAQYRNDAGAYGRSGERRSSARFACTPSAYAASANECDLAECPGDGDNVAVQPVGVNAAMSARLERKHYP